MNGSMVSFRRSMTAPLHQLVGMGAGFDDPTEELLGHLAAMPAGTLLERAADTGEDRMTY